MHSALAHALKLRSWLPVSHASPIAIIASSVEAFLRHDYRLLPPSSLFGDEHLGVFTYAVLHGELRKLIAALFGERAAKAYSWHSIRIGLACALHAAGCPDPVIQLVCRWANPASLKVYRQVGIERNVWTERAQHTGFDATRVNNIPVFDNNDAMLRNLEAFGDARAGPGQTAPQAAARAMPAPTPLTTYAGPVGAVQATEDDANGLVHLRVNV